MTRIYFSGRISHLNVKANVSVVNSSSRLTLRFSQCFCKLILVNVLESVSMAQELNDLGKGAFYSAIHTPHSMVQHVIHVNILRVAQYFKYQPQAMSKTSACIVCYLSTNKRFIIPLQKYVILQLASISLVRVFRNILIPSV